MPDPENVTPPAVPEKRRSAWSLPRIAEIKNHVFIVRGEDDPHAGPVSLDERVAAVQRFVRWHDRQAAIGRELLARFAKEQAAPESRDTIP